MFQSLFFLLLHPPPPLFFSLSVFLFLCIPLSLVYWLTSEFLHKSAFISVSNCVAVSPGGSSNSTFCTCVCVCACVHVLKSDYTSRGHTCAHELAFQCLSASVTLINQPEANQNVSDLHCLCLLIFRLS